MKTIADFKEATGKWVTAPSGAEYRIHGITTMEWGAVTSVMPSLARFSGNGKEDARPNVSLEERDNMTLAWLRIAVSAMRYKGEDYELPPPEKFNFSDVDFLLKAINEASGFAGETAETVKEAL